jgi:hypothetical protein
MHHDYIIIIIHIVEYNIFYIYYNIYIYNTAYMYGAPVYLFIHVLLNTHDIIQYIIIYDII